MLLVDDVMTTGATLSAAARELLRAGAETVRVAVAARTPERSWEEAGLGSFSQLAQQLASD